MNKEILAPQYGPWLRAPQFNGAKKSDVEAKNKEVLAQTSMDAESSGVPQSGGGGGTARSEETTTQQKKSRISRLVSGILMPLKTPPRCLRSQVLEWRLRNPR